MGNYLSPSSGFGVPNYTPSYRINRYHTGTHTDEQNIVNALDK